MKLEEIDKSTLKVGDTVGFQTENYFYNFGYFRYPTTETIIEHIVCFVGRLCIWQGKGVLSCYRRSRASK